MVTINFEGEAIGVERNVCPILRKEGCRERVSCHLKEIGMTEHFVENPRERRICRITGRAATSTVGPFTDADGFWMSSELRQEFFTKCSVIPISFRWQLT